VGEEQSLSPNVNKQAGHREQEKLNLPSNLGEGKAWNCGCSVESTTRVGGEPILTEKRRQLQMACRSVYWSKQKEHASRRTLKKTSLQKQMADSRRQMSPNLR
jgi:hypothetical protein